MRLWKRRPKDEPTVSARTQQEQQPHSQLVQARRLLERVMPRTEAAGIANVLSHDQVDDLLSAGELSAVVLQDARKRAHELQQERRRRQDTINHTRQQPGREPDLLNEYDQRIIGSP